MIIRRFGLAHLTVLELAPPEAVRLAASLGYDYVGVRLHSIIPGGAAYLLGDPAMLRETQAALAATGTGVLDVDLVRIEPTTSIEGLVPFVEAAAALGAKTILVVSGDPDENRFAATFARFCELAASFGLLVDLEFMPWTDVPDLHAATRALEAAGQPNAGVLVDPLHFNRTNGTLSDLQALPRRWLHYVQICDAPAKPPAAVEDLIFAARSERQFPGEGELDLVGFLRAFPVDLPIAVETPNTSLALSARERARRGLEGAKAVLARIAAEPPGRSGLMNS